MSDSAPAVEPTTAPTVDTNAGRYLDALRVGEFRVFYDVEGEAVLIIHVLSKQDCHDYLGGSS